MAALLSHVVSGLPISSGNPVMVCFAGWPDDHGSWDKLAPRFAASHTVITLCLPDLDKRQLARYWGYSFETLVDMLDATLRQLVPRGHPIVLVAHDWGAFVATKYLGREDKSTQVEKYVCLDVGIGLSGGVSGILAAGCYQMYLAGAFLLGRILPTVAGDLMMYVYPWKLIGPCPHDIETGLSNTRTSYTDGLGDGVHCWMNYPYFHMVLNPTAALKLPFPKVPTLYVYGNKKRSMFHDRQFLRRLEKVKGSRWVSLDCGHFIQSEMPRELEIEMRSFLGVQGTRSCL